jgi:hypothetical protein
MSDIVSPFENSNFGYDQNFPFLSDNPIIFEGSLMNYKTDTILFLNLSGILGFITTIPEIGLKSHSSHILS